ncbi:hypothetical protein Aph01nite_16930 [Acrocarpospora phusangensis]|uniref:Uncharacterized protein n=1 Tax=Acrocarpospora phusangensis TaxID=1070424 RepID=A0A919Q9M1_9ACTN|nr:hypothetical protein [Acrocarpospora phusangensis]GIH23383.1 hypothetical protein Aph01nite_16930 [Acrocarpospora phusangensis]
MRLSRIIAVAVVVVAVAARLFRRDPARVPPIQPVTAPRSGSRRAVPLWTMIGTVAAGLAALAALAISVLTFLLQRQQRDEDLDRRRAAFAAKVTWWGEEPGADRQVIVVQNSGYEPILASLEVPETGVLPDLLVTESSSALRLRPPASPADRNPSPRQRWRLPVLDLGALPPCSVSRFTMPRGLDVLGRGVLVTDQSGQVLGSARAYPNGVRLRITDPMGRHWVRYPNGELDEDLVLRIGATEAGPGPARIVDMSGQVSRSAAPYCSGEAPDSPG